MGIRSFTAESVGSNSSPPILTHAPEDGSVVCRYCNEHTDVHCFKRAQVKSTYKRKSQVKSSQVVLQVSEAYCIECAPRSQVAGRESGRLLSFRIFLRDPTLVFACTLAACDHSQRQHGGRDPRHCVHVLRHVRSPGGQNGHERHVLRRLGRAGHVRPAAALLDWGIHRAALPLLRPLHARRLRPDARRHLEGQVREDRSQQEAIACNEGCGQGCTCACACPEKGIPATRGGGQAYTCPQEWEGQTVSLSTAAKCTWKSSTPTFADSYDTRHGRGCWGAVHSPTTHEPMRPSDPRQCMPRVPSQFTLNCVQVWEGSDEGVKGRGWDWAGPWSMLRNGPRSRVRSREHESSGPRSCIDLLKDTLRDQ